MSKTDKQPALWKQLLGALIGASLALVVYWSYKDLAPRLTGYITIPELGIFSGTTDYVRTAARDITDEERARITQRARIVAETYNRRIEREEPEFDVPIEDEISQNNDLVAQEPSALDERVSDDWWKTQLDWEIAEHKAEDMQPTRISTEVVSADMADVIDGSTLSAVVVVPAAEVVRSEAPVLPSSGLGMSMAVGTALTVALGISKRRKRKANSLV